jgi:DNA-binding MarR family transcriptional regulator
VSRQRRRAAARRDSESGIELGLNEDFIGFNLRLAQETSFAVFAQYTASPHLKPGRFATLLVISENPGLSQIELARAIARDKSSVTPLIRGLLEDGLVERRVSESDRRSVTLWLTASGKAALRSLLAHARRHEKKLDAIVGDHRAVFLDLLKKIVRELG